MGTTRADEYARIMGRFLKAAREGNCATIRRLIARGVRVRWCGPQKTTALMAAAETGQTAAVRLLIEHASEINAEATAGWTALMFAAKNGHEETVQELLKAGADPNAENKSGATPLRLAREHGYDKVAGILIAGKAREATAPAIDSLGYAYAREMKIARDGWAGIGRPMSPRKRKESARKAPLLMNQLKRLIARGARGGDRTLGTAVCTGDLDLVRLALRAGANPNAAPFTSSALVSACERGHLEIVRALLDAGASVNFGGISEPPIVVAVEKRRRKVVAELVHRGANVNPSVLLGASPLLVATAAGDIDLMRVLIEAGADLNKRGTVEIGRRPRATVEIERMEDSRVVFRTTHYPDAPEAFESTPLIVAVRKDNSPAVKLLLDSGAKIEATDNEGFTALAWAQRLKLSDIEGLLAAGGARAPRHLEGSPINALIEAAAAGRLDRVRDLLKEGADADGHLDTQDARRTPLAEAATAGHLDIVKCLLKAGAEADKPVGERIGRRNQSPLMLAAEAGHARVVEALIKAGANVQAEDFEVMGATGRDTPLHYAARGGDRKSAEVLLKAGARVFARNKFGETPFQIASSEGHAELVDLFLKMGNRVTGRRGRVSRALHDASLAGNVATVRRLLEANPGAHGSDLDFASTMAFSGKLRVMELLVEYGLPLSGLDREGDSPLMNAVRAGREKMVGFLLGHGADVNAVSKERKTALDLAHEFKHAHLVPQLRKAGGKTFRQIRSSRAAG